MGLWGSIEVKRRMAEGVLDPVKGGGHKKKFGSVCQSLYKAPAVCARHRKACLMTSGCQSRRAPLMTLVPEVCLLDISPLFLSSLSRRVVYVRFVAGCSVEVCVTPLRECFK